MKTMKEIQTQLKKLGFDPGPIDGILGEKGSQTRTATANFQRSRGLTVDGIPGRETVPALFGVLVEERKSPFSQPKAAFAPLRVFIDVGHGQRPTGFDPGAVHGPSKTTEHSLNQIAAFAMANELESLGIITVVDDKNRTLTASGAAAAGYDAMISVHHNATAPGTKAQYSVALVHELKGTQKDKAAAAAISAAVAAELGIRDVGVKSMALGVLSGAKTVKVPVAVLIEPYFIHEQPTDNPPAADMPDWSRRAGKAAGRALAELLKAGRQ